jgi:hypothetical protein
MYNGILITTYKKWKVFWYQGAQHGLFQLRNERGNETFERGVQTL